MRKESAIIRKCSAQRTGEPFHYASIQHILSNVMNAGILRSGETKSEVFPELQIVSLEQFNRVAKTREQRSVNYAIKCGGTTETVQLEDGTEATVVRPPRAYPRKIVGKALLSGKNIFHSKHIIGRFIQIGVVICNQITIYQILTGFFQFDNE